MGYTSDQIMLYMFLKSLQGQDISNLTIILGTCEQCKHNKKHECKLGHRDELREPSTFCCIDFIKEESDGN